MSVDRDHSFPTNAEVNEIKNEFERNGVQGYARYLIEKQDSWKTIPIDIAVIGNSGVGKSTFINAIRGLTADDDGAAAVGVTDTTTTIESYSHPHNPLMKLWDLPGVGTPKFPKETYLKEVGFERFDFFLLLSATRFTENDAWLGGEIKKLGKRFFYVRTKIDDDVRSNKNAHPRTHNATEVLSKIRKSIIENLQDDSATVFLIDSYETQRYETQRYDFSVLEKKLVEDFPGLKRSALVLSMTATSEKMVRLKADELRSRRWRTAALSATVGAVPIPGVSLAFDATAVLKQTEFYMSQLGLDEKSLQRFSKLTSVDLQLLKEVVRESGVTATVQGIKTLAQTLAIVASAAVFEEFSRFAPLFIGSLVAAPLSFGGTYYMLTVILDKLEEAARRVVRLATEKAVKSE